MILETERLILRKYKLKDAFDIYEGLNNLLISKQLSHIPYPYTKKNAIEYVKKKYKQRNSNSFLIELKKEKKVIGALGIGKIDTHNNTATTGSWINKDYQKKGYMSEAKIIFNDYTFNVLKLRKLKSFVFTDNLASIKTQEKIGYKLEGLLKKEYFCKATGKIKDSYVYGLLKVDWIKNKPNIVKKMNF